MPEYFAQAFFVIPISILFMQVRVLPDNHTDLSSLPVLNEP